MLVISACTVIEINEYMYALILTAIFFYFILKQAQMVRRVKAYLSRLQVITDEEQLRNMSLECEAGPEGHKPAGGHSNSSSSGSSSAPPTNPPPRRRPHSPTPSTTSSTSSTSQTSDGKKHTAKFGK